MSGISQGVGPIFLDELSCFGNEERVEDCSRGRPEGLHTCDHSQDVAIRCIGERVRERKRERVSE